jgi:hypothetical protein
MSVTLQSNLRKYMIKLFLSLYFLSWIWYFISKFSNLNFKFELTFIIEDNPCSGHHKYQILSLSLREYHIFLLYSDVYITALYVFQYLLFNAIPSHQILIS